MPARGTTLGLGIRAQLSDVLSIKQTIAREVTDKLRLEIVRRGTAAAGPARHNESEAYQFYLRGRFYWNRRTAEGFKESDRTVPAGDRERSFICARYAGLADAYTTSPGYSATPVSEAAPKARAAAARQSSSIPVWPKLTRRSPISDDLQ